MDEKIDRIKASFEAKRTKFLRLLWCDTANIICAKALYLDHSSMDVGSVSLDEAFLKPDWDTLTFPPYAESHACVMAHILAQGKPWALDSRASLRQILRKLYGNYGINLQVAFKNEFYLVGTNVQHTAYASTQVLNTHQSFLDEFADALTAQGLTIQNVHAEAGPSQLAMALGPGDPLVVADQQILFRETARAIARRHNCVASFLPQVFPDARGSGMRIHFSLWENALNVTGADNPSGLTQTAEYFIAGILFHLPALMALVTPTHNSFRRIQSTPGVGRYAVWGRENREAPIRLPMSEGGLSPTNIEFRLPDASANPYLVLLGLIAAGLDGLKEKYPLAPETVVNPALLSKAERDEKIMMPLHTDLWSALEDFRHNDVLKEAMGEALFGAYLAVKQAEYQASKKLSLDDEVKLFLERY